MSGTRVQQFAFESHQISYRKFGTGASVLLAFHGFGQSSQVFSLLEAWQGGRFTVYAIDLFFHGNSYYKGDTLITKPIWHHLITAFLAEQRINRFSLLGFSLGGRFALATVEAFADRLDELILLAPDGITRSIWYQLATSSAAGRRLFEYFLSHLSLLNGLGHALTRLGLLNRTAMRFAEISLGTPQQRELVYQSWTQFRLIQPDLLLMSQLLIKQSIPVHFFTGAFDRIVPGSYLLPLTKRLNNYQLTVLRTGHNHLIELVAQKP